MIFIFNVSYFILAVQMEPYEDTLCLHNSDKYNLMNLLIHAIFLFVNSSLPFLSSYLPHLHIFMVLKCNTENFITFAKMSPSFTFILLYFLCAYVEMKYVYRNAIVYTAMELPIFSIRSIASL